MNQVIREKFVSVVGNTVVDETQCQVSNVQGLSLLGNKSLRVTDHPAFYLYDGGGFLENELALELTKDIPTHVSVYCKWVKATTLTEQLLNSSGSEDTEKHLEIVIFIRFTPEKTAKALLLHQHKALDNPFLSKIWHWAASISRTQHAELFVPVGLSYCWQQHSQHSRNVQPTTQVETDTNKAAYLWVKLGRIGVDFSDVVDVFATAEWSLSTVKVEAYGDSQLTIEGSHVIQGDQEKLSGGNSGGKNADKSVAKSGNKNTVFIVDLVSAQKRDEFLHAVLALAGGGFKSAAEASQAAKKAPRGLDIDVEGPRFGGVERFQAEILTEGFNIQLNGQTIVHFDFKHDDFRISGTVERLMMFTPEVGPLSISFGVGERARVEALLATPAVIKAAEKTVREGPYPVLIAPGHRVDEKLHSVNLKVALIRVDTHFLSIHSTKSHSTEGDQSFSLKQIQSIKPVFQDHSRLELSVKAKDNTAFSLFSTVPILESLHVQIRQHVLASSSEEHLALYLKSSLGLEEGYFLDAIFGPCYHLHGSLISNQWLSSGAANLDTLLTIDMNSEAAMNEDALQKAWILAKGLEALRLHFDRVIHRLPITVRVSEAQLLEPSSAMNHAQLKKQEIQLRQIFMANLGRIQSEITQLSMMAARMSDYDPGNVKEDYGASAMALGASMLINPVFLIGAAQNAWQQHSSGELKRESMTEQAQHLMERLCTGWNQFVHELIPMVSYSLIEALYPHRLKSIAQLGLRVSEQKVVDIKQQHYLNVCGRLARLDVRRHYPVVPLASYTTTPLTRAALVEHIKRRREKLGQEHLPIF